MAKRSVVIKFKDGTEKELVLSKTTLIRVPKGLMNLDQLQDGTWRLIWSDSLFEDYSKVDRIEIKREDEAGVA